MNILLPILYLARDLMLVQNIVEISMLSNIALTSIWIIMLSSVLSSNRVLYSKSFHIWLSDAIDIMIHDSLHIDTQLVDKVSNTVAVHSRPLEMVIRIVMGKIFIMIKTKTGSSIVSRCQIDGIPPTINTKTPAIICSSRHSNHKLRISSKSLGKLIYRPPNKPPRIMKVIKMTKTRLASNTRVKNRFQNHYNSP